MMNIQKLTKEQAAIISGFTGILCGEFSDFHADVEKRLGRSVQTFEFSLKEFMTEVKKLYKADFIEIGTVDKEQATVQAVPEGFVLVPKESLKVALFWMNEDIDPWQMGGDSFADLFEHKPILEKVLIEAQKSTTTQLIINWGMECPKCNHNKATCYSTATKESGYMFMDGDAVVCLKCGNKGEMDADGENSDIAWGESQEPAND